jgi:PAS domain S-box-containing protein
MSDYPGDATTRGTPCTIIVAADELDETHAIAAALASSGYSVLAAHDRLQVLSQARMSAPELMLLDVDAPRVGGLATCHSLKLDERTRDIPVLLMAASRGHYDLADGFRAGAADHVTKPVHVEELMARVRTHIALRAAHRQLRLRQSGRLDLCESRLKACEARFRAIVESGPVAMGITSMPHGKLLYANARFRELLRVSDEACANVNIGDFYVDPEERERLVRCLATQGSFGDAEVKLRRPDGTQFWAMATARVSTYDDAPAIYVGLHDISRRKRNEDDLVRSREQQRALSAYLEGIREDERKRSALEIQDDLGQLLTALKMDVSLLKMRLTDDPEATGRADDMRELVEGTIWTVRNVASHLRPAALDFGLVSALEWLAGQWSRHHTMPCELHVRGSEPALSDMQTTALFRIVEAALTNVARHAAARRVEVTLVTRRSSLDLRVRDNGRGFDVAAAHAKYAYGLLGMAERARLIGGTLRVDSQPDKDMTIGITTGTTISIHVPL